MLIVDLKCNLELLWILEGDSDTLKTVWREDCASVTMHGSSGCRCQWRRVKMSVHVQPHQPPSPTVDINHQDSASRCNLRSFSTQCSWAYSLFIRTGKRDETYLPSQTLELKYITVVNEASLGEYVLWVLESLSIFNLFSSKMSIRTSAVSHQTCFWSALFEVWYDIVPLNILQALQT